MKEDKNYKQVTAEAREFFHALFTTLDLKTDVFFEIIESLGSNDSYLNLSYDSLMKYQYNLPIKYLSNHYRKLCRTIEDAMSIYIGKNIEDYSNLSDKTLVSRLSRPEITAQLPEEHRRQVEAAWRQNKTPLMDRLFQIHEQAKAIKCSETEYRKLQAEAARAEHLEKFFDILNSLLLEGKISISPMYLDTLTVEALVWLIQEKPQIIASIQKFCYNAKKEYTDAVVPPLKEQPDNAI